MGKHEEVLAKVCGTITALEAMAPKERDVLPSGSFGMDYNCIRSMALDAFPALKDALPPQVEIFKPEQGEPMTMVRFVELHAYCVQIRNLINNAT